MSDESSMTDVQDRAFLLPAVPRINYIAVVPEHDRDKDRGSEMDLRTALKWTARRRMASRRTTATGLDGTSWEDSIVNGGSQRRTTRRRYFRMAPSEGTKGAVGGEPPLPPWRRVCLHAATNRLEGKRKENE
ncbi:hypothetical protein ALC57_13029 [Trachymyrmex cornetzi]|uniref:Uncharacterized protein n=1 Tax=Trachymyrmex cornetzi TaxID=471704 RepID=A0A151J052_9HYME|nr:hypothetical protein ALC57_13029 [Trachymyrmex cornetzi]